MEEVYSIEFENGKTYDVIESIEANSFVYFYLAEENHPENVIIQKVKTSDPEHVFQGIETHEEFQYALSLFKEKHPEIVS